MTRLRFLLFRRGARSMKLEKIMELPVAKKLTLLTKHQEFKRDVVWTHIVEDIDNMRFVEKDNLIFVTGIAIKENQKALLEFIKNAYEKQTAGVVINIGNYINQVSQEIIDFANRVNYPIFTLPWEVKITDINRAICEYIIKYASANKTLEHIIRTIIHNKSELTLDEINHITDYGLDVKGRYNVMIVELIAEEPTIEEQISHQAYHVIKNILMLSYEKHICFFENNKMIVVLPEIAGIKLEGQEIRKRLLEHTYLSTKKIQVKIGFGKSCSGIKNIYKSYQEALKVIYINTKRDNYDFYYYNELGFYKLVLDIKDSREMKTIYKETIGQLIQYDKMHHTDYVEVLKVYLLENKSITDVSKKLYIHRNTVTYKLKKIEELLGIDLNSVDDTIKIKLAILVHDLL